MKAIYKRELKAYFTSFLGYLFIASLSSRDNALHIRVFFQQLKGCIKPPAQHL